LARIRKTNPEFFLPEHLNLIEKFREVFKQMFLYKKEAFKIWCDVGLWLHNKEITLSQATNLGPLLVELPPGATYSVLRKRIKDIKTSLFGSGHKEKERERVKHAQVAICWFVTHKSKSFTTIFKASESVKGNVNPEGLVSATTEAVDKLSDILHGNQTLLEMEQSVGKDKKTLEKELEEMYVFSAGRKCRVTGRSRGRAMKGPAHVFLAKLSLKPTRWSAPTLMLTKGLVVRQKPVLSWASQGRLY
jgi:hypothetical protein